MNTNIISLIKVTDEIISNWSSTDLIYNIDYFFMEISTNLWSKLKLLSEGSHGFSNQHQEYLLKSTIPYIDSLMDDAFRITFWVCCQEKIDIKIVRHVEDISEICEISSLELLYKVYTRIKKNIPQLSDLISKIVEGDFTNDIQRDRIQRVYILINRLSRVLTSIITWINTHPTQDNAHSS